MEYYTLLTPSYLYLRSFLMLWNVYIYISQRNNKGKVCKSRDERSHLSIYIGILKLVDPE